ncbi:MAG: ATP-binding protein, partial [Deltaproteobacteria bacterium]|nr:ATP-binding protein [Deltaproteobacteria bacterium]
EGDSVSIDLELYICCCLNIIDNSIKASENGSEIIIKLEVNSKIFKTEIKDFGKGMDNKKIQHICKPFYQGDQSRTSGNEGIGMGLSIVEQIVLNNLCGELTISSIPGHGTSICINIPVAKGTED